MNPADSPRFAPETEPDVDPYLDRNPGPDPGPDDATAALLRGVLRREAETVQPSPDGLARILAAARPPSPPADPPDALGSAADGRPLLRPARPGRFGGTVPLARRPLTLMGTCGERPRGLVRWMPMLSAAAAVMVVCAGLGMARLGWLGWLKGPGLDAVAGRPPVTAPARTSPAEPLPVYLVERQNGHWALVREFVPTTLTDPADRLTTAMRLAVSGTGTDPDHTSAWRAAGLPATAAQVTARRDAAGLVVRLPGPLLGSAPKDARDARDAPPAQLAVQQLVWTATATTHTTGAVRVEGPTPGAVLFGGYRLGGNATRDSSDRAPVWVASVGDGQRLVPGRAVIAGDAARTARGTVTWRLLDPTGVQVDGGQAPLRQETQDSVRVGDRGVWEVALQLPTTGRYRFEVAQSWPGARTATDPAWVRLDWVDSKTLLVH